MPSPTSFIRRFVNELPGGEPFTTSECLKFGSRAAVDQALSRLAKSGYIVRVARGVFVKGNSDAPLPSVYEIAKAKAGAFGRKIFAHASDLALKLTKYNPKLLSPIERTERPTFVVNACTSSFDSIHGRINFKGTTPRKTPEPISRPKEAIQVLWHLGKHAVTGRVVEDLVLSFTRQEREELHQSGGIVPGWMAPYICRFHKWPGSSRPLLEYSVC